VRRNYSSRLESTVRRAPLLVLATLGALGGIWIARTQRVRELEFEIEQRAQLALAPMALSNRIVCVRVSPPDNERLTGQALDAAPRRFHAELIDGLKRVGARVLVFDLLFTAGGDPENNRSFTQALSTSSPLLVSMIQWPNNEEDPHKRNGYSYMFEPPDILPRPLPPNISLGQAEPVYTGPLTGDVALLCKDDETGREVPNVALLAFCQVYGVDPKEVRVDWRELQVEAGPGLFQIDREGGMEVAWGSDDPFEKAIPLSEALSILRKGDPSGRFKDKIVFVGSENDRSVRTVVGKQFGISVLANALNTMLRSNHGVPKRISDNLNAIWPYLASVLTCLALSSRRPAAASVRLLAVFLLLGLFPVGLLKLFGQMPDITEPTFAAILAALVCATARLVLPKAIVFVPAEMFEATVLFADLKNSTPLVDALGARAGGSVLNSSLRLAKRIVLRANGEVIRTQGDALVAVFRARPGSPHALAAAETAKRIVDAGLQSDVPFRAGLESGLVHRDNQGIQGLPFHSAVRLQALGSELGEDLVIGPVARGLLAGEMELRSPGVFELRGIAGKVQVWVPDGRVDLAQDGQARGKHLD